ncbi:hypothetical protein BHE74_00046728, partial [Ensete ventricosum]
LRCPEALWQRSVGVVPSRIKSPCKQRHLRHEFRHYFVIYNCSLPQQMEIFKCLFFESLIPCYSTFHLSWLEEFDFSHKRERFLPHRSSRGAITLLTAGCEVWMALDLCQLSHLSIVVAISLTSFIVYYTIFDVRRPGSGRTRLLHLITSSNGFLLSLSASAIDHCH